jgi:hypothetical protein
MGKPLPSLTYSNLNPYSVFGGSVIVRESYKDRGGKSYMDFVVQPSNLLRDYAYSRFYTTGQPQRMVFDIRHANVTHKTEEGGMAGFFSGADKDVYNLDILIAMSVIKPDGRFTNPFTITIDRQLEVPQNASVAEREYQQFRFMEKTMHDIDRAVSEIVVNKLQ